MIASDGFEGARTLSPDYPCCSLRKPRLLDLNKFPILVQNVSLDIGLQIFRCHLEEGFCPLQNGIVELHGLLLAVPIFKVHKHLCSYISLLQYIFELARLCCVHWLLLVVMSFLHVPEHLLPFHSSRSCHDLGQTRLVVHVLHRIQGLLAEFECLIHHAIICHGVRSDLHDICGSHVLLGLLLWQGLQDGCGSIAVIPAAVGLAHLQVALGNDQQHFRLPS
mmetsp:Transcript_81364/g.141190  ORF Transcript_81364/g.141190 Transcript_81364/m.141190 type:complete len:221 (-) Transcript_81364:963-1625(-)